MTVDAPFREHRDGFVKVVVDEAASEEEKLLARAAYGALLPMTALSRCPFTGRTVEVPFDDVDLDGPFWDALEPVRRDPDPGLPATCLSIAGAIRVDVANIRPAPFLALPGPGRPCVVPDLLKVDGVIVVLSAVAIGPHQGLCQTYFGEDVDLPPALRTNVWGARSYRYVYDDGRVVEGESELYDLDNDYDLGPWVELGKVAWIAPGDPHLTVQRGAECPYVSPEWSSAPNAVQRVFNGEVNA